MNEVPSIDESQFTFVELDESSLDEAVEVGTRAFNGGDGVPGELANDWVLKGGGDAVTADTRIAYHRSMQKACFLQARNFGGIVLGVKGTSDTDNSGKLLGYAILHPPGTPLKPGSTDEICMFTHLMCCKGVGEPPVSAAKIGDVGAKRYKQFEKAMARKELAELRKDYQGKYWKLELLAVDTLARGKGAGKALMKAVQHIVDQDGSAAYVECAGDRLPGFYKKYGGFDAGEESFTMKLPEENDGISFTGLIRAPKMATTKNGQVAPKGSPQETTMTR